MKKLHLKTPNVKLPKVSRKTLYIAGGTLIVLSLFSLAAVSQVRAERIQKAHDAAVAASAKEEKQKLQDQVTAALTAKSAEKHRADEVCQWVRGVAPKYRIQVPPLCRQ